MLSGYVANKLFPRGPGRTPKKFKTWMLGKIGRNLLWKQGGASLGVETVLDKALEQVKGWFAPPKETVPIVIPQAKQETLKTIIKGPIRPSSSRFGRPVATVK